MKACLKCDHVNPDEISFCEECGIMLPGGDNEPDQLLGTLLINKFRIEELIGQGAMGRVYRATQEPINRQVAVKILHQHLLEDRRVAKRFQREAEAASRFAHPNSIGIFDFGQTKEGALYIAMEYITGSDLADVITRQAPFSPERTVRIATQTLNALHLAHASSIIHRDLKPENIMLSDLPGQKDFVKVCDFGIAKIQEQPGAAGQESALTMFGMICGTPYYMSPEQAKGEELDGRTDLYSMGVILYEMLTGEVPFRGSTPVEVIARHLTDPPLPPSKLSPNLRIPRALEDVVLRALSKKREERFDDAQQFADALEQALKEAEFQADLERVLQQAQTPAQSNTPANQLEASQMIPQTVMDGGPRAFQSGSPRKSAVTPQPSRGPAIASPKAVRTPKPFPPLSRNMSDSFARNTPVPSLAAHQQNPPLLLTDPLDDVEDYAQPKRSKRGLILAILFIALGIGGFLWFTRDKAKVAKPSNPIPVIRGYAEGMNPNDRRIPTPPQKRRTAARKRSKPKRYRKRATKRRRRVARMSKRDRASKRRFHRQRGQFVSWKKRYRFWFADLGPRIEFLFNQASKVARHGKYEQANSIFNDMLGQIKGYKSTPAKAIDKKYARLNKKFTRIREKMKPHHRSQVDAFMKKASFASFSNKWDLMNNLSNQASRIIDHYK